MKHLFMILCIGALLAGCASSAPQADFRQVDQETAKELMRTESDYVILDVRTYEEYAEGHIPGAICVPNETIGDDPLAELPDKDQLILVYCRSGRRSKEAAGKLADAGYTNIVEFGGIIQWDGDIEV